MKPTSPSIATQVKPASSKLVPIAAAAILSITGVALWKFLPRDHPVQPEPQKVTRTDKTPPANETSPLQFEEPTRVPTKGETSPPTAGNPETQPILAIPRNAGGKEGVPKGFGFADEPGFLLEPQPTNPPAAQTPPPAVASATDKGFMELEKPAAPAAPAAPATKPADTVKPAEPESKSVGTADPRDIGITVSDGPQKEFEETSLTVQRTLTAVSGENKQLIRLKIPVMYQSRTMRLEGESLKEAQRIRTELRTKTAELKKIRTDMEILLKNWNQLVENTTPQTILLPESPTLPQNQSANPLNRTEDNAMTPGKAISFEILDK